MARLGQQLLFAGLMFVVPWGLTGCGNDDDEFTPDDDDATADDDDDETADDDDDATADDDDDATADDDDDATAGDDANFDPVLGPTGPSSTGVRLSVGSFPVTYVVPYIEGEGVWIAVSLDDNGSGLQGGPDSGDIVGFHPSRVTVSATGIDVTLDTLVP